MREKQRLDIRLYEQGLAPSRAKARGMIMAGEVMVNGKLVDKPGTPIALDAIIKVKEKQRFVSRGGDKLAGALADFKYDVSGQICADVGASTGGFTDCLLQNGAARIYAIDVGYGQLDYVLRQNDRVVVLERTNARYIDKLPEPVGLVTIDASFISLRLLLPAVKSWLTPQGDVIALIKPQFEAGKADVGKGGVIRDTAVHRRVLRSVLDFSQRQNFLVKGLTRSALTGPAGNVEFLMWLNQGSPSGPVDIDSLIAAIF